MAGDIRVKWDRRYGQSPWPTPVKVLLDYQHLLPEQGIALDLACGLGANALFLAEQGLRVEAWDLSSVAIERLREKATVLNLDVQPRVRDVTALEWPRSVYDVIVVSRFLCRPICSLIQAALRPGGMLFYQTFVRNKVAQVGPSNLDYLLVENELLHLFPDLILRTYREEGQQGDILRGWRNEACLVGQKPLEKMQ